MNGAPAPRANSTAYIWYVVTFFAACHLVSFLDRNIITLVVQPIKQDLGLSDASMGLIVGLGFVLLFSFFGIPLGRLADVMNRRLLISIGIIVWSVATALCGLATSFWTLMFARIGVGLGEAALAPAAFSIMSQVVPPEKMGRAASMFTLGAAIGRTVGLLGGGTLLIWLAQPTAMSIPWLAAFKPWQVLFMVCGLLGILLLVLMPTIKEPPRAPVKAGGETYSVMETLRYIHANGRGYYPYIVACCCVITLGQGINAWLPTFFVRKYGLTPGESGALLGALVIVPSILGNIFGGWAADKLRMKGYIDAPNRLLVIAMLGSLPLVLMYTLTSSLLFTQVSLALQTAVLVLASGPSIAGAQLMTPPARRGVVTAVFLGVVNLASLGIGPTLVGALTDFVFRDEAALPYSIATAATIIVAIGATAAWMGRKGFADAAKAASA